MTRVVLNNGDVELLTEGYGSAEKYLMERLVEKAREVWPNVPTFDDVASDPEMPKPNEYAQQCVKYSSLSAAAKEAHRRVQIEHEPEEPEEKPSAEPNSKERSPAMRRHDILSQSVRRACNDYDDGSILVKRHSVDPEVEVMKVKMQKSETKKMRGKTFSDEKLVEAVKAFYDEYGDLPTRKEWHEFIKDKDLPCWNTLYNRLGGKVGWLKRIGVEESGEEADELSGVTHTTVEMSVSDVLNSEPDPDEAFAASGMMEELKPRECDTGANRRSEEIREAWRLFCKGHGHSPNTSECRASNGLPAEGTLEEPVGQYCLRESGIGPAGGTSRKPSAATSFDPVSLACEVPQMIGELAEKLLKLGIEKADIDIEEPKIGIAIEFKNSRGSITMNLEL